MSCSSITVCQLLLTTTNLGAILEMNMQLVEFAREGYREAEPLPFYRSPTSNFGRVVAELLMCAPLASYWHDRDKDVCC